MTAPLFVPDRDGFEAAPMTRGPWDPRMMHGGAPSALLARAIEAVEPGADLVVTRLTIDFLGGVPLGRVAVAARVVRPGRRFALVDATLTADGAGRDACLARAVRIRRADLPAAAATPATPVVPLPRPEEGIELPSWVPEDGLEYFYPAACEIRHVAGEFGSGVVAAWIRLRGPVVAGEDPSPLSRVAAAADYANGLSWIHPWSAWLFINTELTIHLHREAEGEWIGLAARTASCGGGFALATGTLHDLRGPIGVCAQSLFVAPR